MRTRSSRALVLAAVLATILSGCGSGGSKKAASVSTTATSSPVTEAASTTTTTEAPTSTAVGPASTATSAGAARTTTAPAGDPVVLAAGDIGSCSSNGDSATAALLAARPSASVITLGDNAYEKGTSTEYASCYGPTWGGAKQRTRPAVGNHEYLTAGASGYFGYFGAAAGDPARGYYSLDLGAWHLVALNANCSNVPCGAGSEQERWLRSDLAAHPTACTLAYWHQPRFSSGSSHGSSTSVGALWQALYDGNADLVLSGHEHNYERFAPLDPSGRVEAGRGIRSFVVGTGGRSHYPFGPAVPGSEVRNGDTYGVLQLTLHGRGFDWQFVPEAGRAFADAGTASCH